MVTALLIRPGEHPIPTLLCDEGEFLNLSVSLDACTCYTAVACRIEDGIAVLYGEESCILGQDGNRCIDGHIFAGPIYIIGYEGDKLVSLSDADIARYTAQLWEPELFTKEEVIDSYISRLWDD